MKSIDHILMCYTRMKNVEKKKIQEEVLSLIFKCKMALLRHIDSKQTASSGSL